SSTLSTTCAISKPSKNYISRQPSLFADFTLDILGPAARPCSPITPLSNSIFVSSPNNRPSSSNSSYGSISTHAALPTLKSNRSKWAKPLPVLLSIRTSCARQKTQLARRMDAKPLSIRRQQAVGRCTSCVNVLAFPQLAQAAAIPIPTPTRPTKTSASMITLKPSTLSATSSKISPQIKNSPLSTPEPNHRMKRGLL